jgi:hypothetical protein
MRLASSIANGKAAWMTIRWHHVVPPLIATLVLGAAGFANPAPAAAATGIWTCYNQPPGEYCWGGSDRRHDYTLGKIQNQSGDTASVCMRIEEFGGSHVGTEHTLCPFYPLTPDGTDTWNFGTAYSSGWPLGSAGAQSPVHGEQSGNNFWNYWQT